MNRRTTLGTLLAMVMAAIASLLPAHTASAHGGTIAGIVYAERAPVEGATVVLSNREGEVARAVTGARGGFEFPRVAPGRYIVSAFKDGVGRGRVEAGVREGQTVHVRIELRRTNDQPGALAGVVFNAEGVVGDAQVVLSRDNEVVGRTVTNAEGRFGFSPLRPGVYKVEAFKRGVGTGVGRVEVAAGQTANIRIELRAEPRTGQIIGLVNDSAGNPVGEANVVVRRGDREVARTVSGADGRYVFPNLPAGDYVVFAAKRGVGEGRAAATVVAGSSVRAIITLQGAQAGSLTVFAVTEAGPVAEANVVVAQNGVVVARGVTLRDGSISFPNLRPGSYVVEAFKRGVGSGRGTAEVTAGGTTSIRVRLAP
jgi:uncharacterized protein (DUF2141 family)